MNVRFTVGVSALSALVVAGFAACSANGNDAGGGPPGPDVEGGPPVVVTTDAAPDAGPAVTDDAGTITPTGDGGSATFGDSGPPATIGGDDSGTPPVTNPDSGLPPGTCNALTDCPYQSAPGVSGVSCDTTNHVCLIECAGDSYDVNGNVTDGCEILNPCPTGNGTQHCPVEHTTATATDLGSFSCDDTASKQSDTGAVPSDDRTHVGPAVVAFDGTVGAAPTVFHIKATGGALCEDDLNLNLQVKAPSAHLNCYSFVAQVVNGKTYTCQQTDPTGLCQISNGSGSYSDGSDIYLIVTKIASCLATEPDNGAFTIAGHL